MKKSLKCAKFEEVIPHGDYHIFTDGATFNNGRKDPNLPSLGGWGFVVLNNNKDIILEDSGFPITETTISLMEMEAVIQSIKQFIKSKCTRSNYENPINITITSDSQYVITGITEWIYNWKKKNWLNNERKPVANKEQWETIAALSGIDCGKVVNITWFKCKSHTNFRENDLADKLASLALKDCRKYFGV